MKSKIIIVAICLLFACLSLAVVAQDERFPGTRPPDKTNCSTEFDCSEGIVKLGDRVIYFTDDNRDGLFEKNLAFVIDDVNATAVINGTSLQVGNLVNLKVEPSASASQTQSYRVFSVKRGRSIGQYEALTTSN